MPSRPPDRVIGALCLVVAAVAATWGRGPAEGSDGGGRPQEVLGVSVEGTGPASPEAVTAAPPATETTTTTSAAPAAASSSTTAPSTTTTTAAPTRQADEALARKALLAQADLPGGFVLVRPAPAGPAADTDGPFERCLGADAAALTAAVRARARSGEFGRSGAGTVSSSSAVLDTPVSAEKVLSTLATPAARGCFESLINARLARNPKLSEDARGKLSPLQAGGFGDQSTGFRFEVELPAEDVEGGEEPSEEKVRYIADFVFVRRGRVLALLEFGNLRQPFPPAELSAVTANLVRRL